MKHVMMMKRQAKRMKMRYDPATETWVHVEWDAMQEKKPNEDLFFLKDNKEMNNAPPTESVRDLSDQRAEKLKSACCCKLPLAALITLASVGGSCGSKVVDIFISFIGEGRSLLRGYVSRPWIGELIFDVGLLCAARLVVQFNMQSPGSGIPEIRCMLSGRKMVGFLSNTGWRKEAKLDTVEAKGIFKSLWTWLRAAPVKLSTVKAVGLALSIGGGLPLGKEGPFVHIAASMSRNFFSLPCFHHLSFESCRSAVLLCAVSVGAGCTFSAPVGGLLFAFELMMPHHYTRDIYVMAFIASSISAFCFVCLKSIKEDIAKPMISSDVQIQIDHLTHQNWVIFLLLCFVVASVSGICGGLFVHFHAWLNLWVSRVRGTKPCSSGCDCCRRHKTATLEEPLTGSPPPAKKKGPSLWKDLAILVIVGCLTAAIRTVGPFAPIFFAQSESSKISLLISKDGVPNSDWTVYLMFLVVSWLHTALALNMPVPSGCVAPALVLGGVIGRFVCCLVPSVLWSYMTRFTTDEEAKTLWAQEIMGRLALVGATSFTVGLLRIVSTVVAVFEVVGSPQMVLPLCLAAVSSTWMANRVSDFGLFDSILKIKKIACLPNLILTDSMRSPVSDHMIAIEIGSSLVLPVLIDTSVTKIVDLEVRVFARFNQFAAEEAPSVIPIVRETKGGVVMCGCVRMSDLEHVFKALRAATPEGNLIHTLDVLHGESMLCTPATIKPRKTLPDTYLHANNLGETCFMVVDEGYLKGIVTVSSLLKID